MQGHVLSCTFCKKTERQVRKLVAGPGVYICDRCTDRAHAIVHEGSPPSADAPLWQRVTRQLRRFVARRTGRMELRSSSAHSV